MGLKVVKFDTKMYLNFSNFRGQTSAGEGQALVQKRGQVSDGGGGLTKFSPDGEDPRPPQEKNPEDGGRGKKADNLYTARVQNRPN